MKTLPSFLLLLLLSSLLAQAQPQAQPPSLQMGLNGLTFKPGGLDAALILELVAEKQDEIKKKAVKSLILRQLNSAGGTVYIYADNVLNSVMTEKDNAVRTRNILENTVNLVFAMALAEYIRKNQESVPAVPLRALTMALQSRQAGKEPVSAPPTVTVYRTDDSFQSLPTGKQKSGLAFLYTLDVVSEAIRTNPRLSALGLMRTTYPGQWNALNLYTSESNAEIKALAKTVEEETTGQLELLLNNIGFVTQQIEGASLSYPAVSSFSLVTGININAVLFDSTVQKAIEAAEKLLSDNSNDRARLFQTKYGKHLSEYWMYLQKVKAIGGSNLTQHQASDLLYHLTNDVKPVFETVSEFLPGVSELFTNTQTLENMILVGANRQTTITQNSSLIRVIAKLYQFKKARTYSDYLNIMTDLPALIDDAQIRSTLNTILAFVKNYVSIKQDAQGHELVAIDIESLLVMLQTYSQNRPKTVQFMFTAGANTGYRAGAAPDTVRNFAFVGEKIGLKIKLKDWHYLRSFNKYQTFYRRSNDHNSAVIRLQPPQEPTVSNLHVLVYGSGILYNLVNSSNNTNFRQPLVGLGIGLTFVNSLDMNLSMNFPQKSGQTFGESFSYPFINLGFDVLFSEYLDRLFKKRGSAKAGNAN
jgi:hypothetical protein